METPGNTASLWPAPTSLFLRDETWCWLSLTQPWFCTTLNPEELQTGTFYSAIGVTVASLVIFCHICVSLVTSTAWERAVSVCFPLPKNCYENCQISLSNQFCSRSSPWVPALQSPGDVSQAAALRGCPSKEAPGKPSIQKTTGKQVGHHIFSYCCKNLTYCQAWDQRRVVAPDLAQKRNSHAF